MSMHRFLFSPADVGAAAPYLMVDSFGAFVGRGTLSPGQAVLPQPPTTLVIPGTDVLARWIELPGATTAQANAAARFLLADMVASTPDSLHVAVARDEADGRRLVCVIDRSLLQAHLAGAKTYGVVPDQVIPDYLLLPAPEDGSTLIAAWGDRLLLRGKELGASIESDVADLLLRGQRTTHLADPDAVVRVMATGAQQIPIDLLQQDFAPRVKDSWGSAPLRRIASLAAVLLLSPLLLWGAELLRGEWAAVASEARTAEMARTLAADAPDPVAAVQGRMHALAANGTLLKSAAALFEGLEGLDGAELERMSWLADENVLSATLVHNSAADITELARSVADAGFVLTEDGSAPIDSRVSTSIALRPAP
jgi:general secretion pathway protein L